MRRSFVILGILWASILILTASGFDAYAAIDFEVTSGIGYLTGHSSYQIGYVPKEDDFVTPPREPYFPISELKFPLMSGIATLDAKVSVGRFSLSGGARKNFTRDTGMMRDYDWGMPYYDREDEKWYVRGYYYTDNPSYVWYDLDVESKSRTQMDAKMWNAKASCLLYTYSYDYYEPNWLTRRTEHRKGDLSVSVGIGYEKRSFDFETQLVRQWSPSGHDEEYAATGDGSDTCTYNVDYSIPYVEMGLAHHSNKTSFEIDLGVSTLVHVKDEDVHLIRVPGPSYNEGNLSGRAFKVAARLLYDLTPHWFLSGAVDYIHIRASGTQHQHIDAGSTIEVIDGIPTLIVWDASDYPIEERVVSQQSCFTFNVGFRFGLPGKSG